MYHGACLLSVASSIRSRACEYSYHFSRDGRSITLSFHWRIGSVMRASNRLACSSLLTSSQYLMRMTPPSVMYFSKSGTFFRNPSCCSFVQKPITYSTPARLYQLRSKMTTSPAAGKCGDVALHEHLRLLAIGRRGQRHDAEDARAHALGDARESCRPCRRRPAPRRRR